MESIQPTIPQNNPAAIVEELRTEIDDAIRRVLYSGRYILGEEVEAFEEEWANWCGVEHAIGCASGTDGLELILRALDLPAGARVLAPSHTAVATIAAIVRAGCRPFLADVDEASFTLSPDSAVRCLEAATAEGDPIQALIAVHLYGQPCDLDMIQDLCNARGIPLIEDGSQAHGARWRGKRVGGFGVAAAFSLYPTKNLGALGDAGVVTTNDSRMTKRMKQLRQYGWQLPAISEEPGINSRLDPMQAAILRVKLSHLEEQNSRRQTVAKSYIKQLMTQDKVILPQDGTNLAGSVFHQFVVKLPERKRDAVRTQLKDLGIGTMVHYPQAAHQMPAYRNKPWVGLDPAGLSITEKLLPQILSLPMGPHLKIHEAKRVSECLTNTLIDLKT
ncbi:hypothetical protein KR100_01475 [Synechococcus sp. KORDI-100]|uniref:DegT/DnrJ/EryC1/StrS family aminotransferase n=1 Tax=Synechococcus sp. KORDI-100 TaxID=1280380 RepID=UPI0004E0708F|nr:DegT/DnrJ/EryC1/StrS family aminotransferase [Synechococcus sp. KORDI-100]AII42077.1 hypothetical protein KR100_01475 [Synechococcus sp. KORDI-100]